MDYKIIREIIESMDNSKLTELEINWQGIILKMKKDANNICTSANKNFSADKEVQTFCKNDAHIAEKKHEDAFGEEYDEKDCFVVKSPIVGTFYSSPGEDKLPFVEAGQKVKKGQVLCIIEAMKLMNEIECEEDGEIEEILVKNGEMVEYGEPLFKIKK